jgi:hypothetical protein
MKPLLNDEKKTALQTAGTSKPQRIDHMPMSGPFVHFTYSSQEIHTSGGRTHVKLNRVQLKDGKLTSQQFEGQLPLSVYAQSVSDNQRWFMDQTVSFLKQFSTLFLLLMKHRSGKE